jgi:hypothetical protein
MGGTLMSAEIIQFIPRPKHDREQTDFPTIAFRSVVHDLVTDRAEPPPCKCFEPDRRET